jgi:hypothetical protein
MASDQLGPLFGLLRDQLFKGRIVDEFVFTAHANKKGMNFDDDREIILWLAILFPFNDPLNCRHLVLLDSGFLFLLTFPHRLEVLLVLLSRLGKSFIAPKGLEGHRLELHFLCDSIRFKKKQALQ